MTDINQLGLDECRDEAAKMMGWECAPGGWWSRKDQSDSAGMDQHPLSTTADGALSAMPDGWEVTFEQRLGLGWEASAMNLNIEGPDNIRTAMGDDLKLAAWRLCLACLRAAKEKQDGTPTV